VVAIGCTNGGYDRQCSRRSLTARPGVVAVYDISNPLKDGEPLGQGNLLWPPLDVVESEVFTDILPQFYTSIHQSGVRAVTWLRVPPSSSSGSLLWDEDPVIIATGGYDGAQGYIDLRDGAMNEFNRTRGRCQQSDIDRGADWT